jgi:hypothetical protein
VAAARGANVEEMGRLIVRNTIGLFSLAAADAHL